MISRSSLFYFAYGSNMSVQRLDQRVPGVRRLGAASLAGHELRFHKSGSDGSGKCDAFYTGLDQHELHGVLFELDSSGKRTLDRFEGLGAGYDEKTVSLALGTGESVEAVTYVATRIDAALQPFHWYKAHVLIGARSAALPSTHIDRIVAEPALDDPDRERHQREMSLYPDHAI